MSLKEQCEDYIKYMQANKLEKPFAIDVLNEYVNVGVFINRLKDFVNMDSHYGYYDGHIFSNDIDDDDYEYFGKDKVMFFEGDGDDDYSILDYKELYEYLEVTCKFYVDRNPEDIDIIKSLLAEIKEKYN